MRRVQKFGLILVGLCVAAVILWTTALFRYSVEGNLSNLKEQTQHWLNRGNLVPMEYSVRLYGPVSLDNLVYVPMEVGPEQNLGYIRLERGFGGRCKIAGTSYSTGSFYTGVLDAEGERRLMFLGRNRSGEITKAEFHWDGGDEYENAVPAGGYTYELAIPQEAVFLVCVPVDGNIPLGPVLPEQIALYDAQERNITDRFPLSGGWIQ